MMSHNVFCIVKILDFSSLNSISGNTEALVSRYVPLLDCEIENNELLTLVKYCFPSSIVQILYQLWRHSKHRSFLRTEHMKRISVPRYVGV